MSSRKRPLAEISGPTHRTPARSAPSTPHTRRALEQRTAAKQRSVKGRKSLHAGAQPLSIGGILRRLAKATAAQTQKSHLTPLNDKENATPRNRRHDGEDDGSDEDETDATFSPRLMNFARNVNDDEDEDSEIPTAPTPSVLPDDDDAEEEGGQRGGRDPTLTFKAIDFARGSLENGRPASEKPRRSSGRVSFAPVGNEEVEVDDDDDTVLTAEMGRRAMSEGPLDRYNRNSFGSIRMSDFAFDIEQRRQSGKTDASGFIFDDYMPAMGDDEEDLELTQGAETRDLRNLQEEENNTEQNIFVSPHGEHEDEGTFILQLPEAAGNDPPKPATSPSLKRRLEQSEEAGDEEFEDVNSGSDEDAGRESALEEGSPSHSRRQTLLERVASRPRKKLKLTRHGIAVPALPASLLKQIACDARTRVGKKKPVLGKDHIKALEQATEWFLEQVGEDLEAYSNHARRKKRIIGSDVLTLMRRQRVLKKPGDLAKLAKEWLPAKVLKELDLPNEL